MTLKTTFWREFSVTCSGAPAGAGRSHPLRSSCQNIMIGYLDTFPKKKYVLLKNRINIITLSISVVLYCTVDTSKVGIIRDKILFSQYNTIQYFQPTLHPHCTYSYQIPWQSLDNIPYILVLEFHFPIRVLFSIVRLCLPTSPLSYKELGFYFHQSVYSDQRSDRRLNKTSEKSIWQMSQRSVSGSWWRQLSCQSSAWSVS